MVPTVAEYRRAAEADRCLAARKADEGERQALLRIAAVWNHLAQYRETRTRLQNGS